MGGRAPGYRLSPDHFQTVKRMLVILGDPGAVSRAGLKGATKVFKHGRKSPWVPTLTGPFPNGQENAGHPRRPRGSQSGRVKRRDRSFQAWAEEPLGADSHRTISKRSRECWFLTGHKKCFLLLRPIGEQFLLSSYREFVHDGYYLATVARFVHQAFLTRNEGTTDESKNVSDAISRSNSICTEKILFLTDHNVS